MSWIDPLGPLEAFWSLLSGLPFYAGRNQIAFCMAAIILLLPALRPRAQLARLICLIVIAALAATLFMLIINEQIPIIVTHYFSFLAVEFIVILSLIIAPFLAMQPILAVMLTVIATVQVYHSSISAAHDRRWLADADIVAQLVAQCPQTRVHAGSRWLGVGFDPINRIGPPQIDKIGLTNIASIDHVAILPLAVDAPEICPVIYWTEIRGPKAAQITDHNGNIVAASNDYAGFGIDRAELSHTKAIRTKNGMGVILVVSPQPNEGPKQ